MTEKNHNKTSLHHSETHMQNSDEIDLKALFFTLWRGKWLIIAITALFTLLAIAYALTAQQWWSSKAVVTQPTTEEIASYQSAVNTYLPVFPDLRIETNATLFTRWLALFNSADNKRAFLETSPEMAAIKKELNLSFADEEAENRFNQTWFDKITLQPTEKGSKESYTLNVQSITSHSSKALLNAYIEFTNQELNQQIYRQQQLLLDYKITALHDQYALLLINAQRQLALELKKTENALTIAEQAHLLEPQENLGDNEIFPINIGGDALKAKVSVLRQLTDLSIINPELEDAASKITYLDGKQRIDEAQPFQSYRFLSSPEALIGRDKPKRSLIVIIGFLLGGMIGCGVVLVRSAFCNTATTTQRKA